jgi:hypothetical protein
MFASLCFARKIRKPSEGLPGILSATGRKTRMEVSEVFFGNPGKKLFQTYFQTIAKQNFLLAVVALFSLGKPEYPAGLSGDDKSKQSFHQKAGDERGDPFEVALSFYSEV